MNKNLIKASATALSYDKRITPQEISELVRRRDPKLVVRAANSETAPPEILKHILNIVIEDVRGRNAIANEEVEIIEAMILNRRMPQELIIDKVLPFNFEGLGRIKRPNMEFAAKVRDMRIKLGVKQADFAQSIYKRPADLCKIENAYLKPADETVTRILQGFKANGAEKKDLEELNEIAKRAGYAYMPELQAYLRGYKPKRHKLLRRQGDNRH